MKIILTQNQVDRLLQSKNNRKDWSELLKKIIPIAQYYVNKYNKVPKFIRDDYIDDLPFELYNVLGNYYKSDKDLGNYLAIKINNDMKTILRKKRSEGIPEIGVNPTYFDLEELKLNFFNEMDDFYSLNYNQYKNKPELCWSYLNLKYQGFKMEEISEKLNIPLYETKKIGGFVKEYLGKLEPNFI